MTATVATMLKFAFAAGTAAEWLLGPSVDSALGLAYASAHVVMGTILGWLVLETLRAVGRTVMSYDNKPRAVRR
jgi:hypothetical protein